MISTNNNPFSIFKMDTIRKEFLSNNLNIINTDIEKKHIKKFTKLETHFYYNNQCYIFPEIATLSNILLHAINAIEILESITKENKKLAYYESNKNASLDDLIEHYENKLNEKGENELITESSKKEVNLKKLLTELKIDNATIYNYYLVYLNIFGEQLELNEELKDLEILYLLSNFFGIGHSTKSQIIKSVALQIYELYKDDSSNLTTLTKDIGELIDSYFETNTPYTNFKNFNKKKPYIKNVVGDFVVFDINDKKNEEQELLIKTFFENNSLDEIKMIDKNELNDYLNLNLPNPIKWYLETYTLKFTTL